MSKSRISWTDETWQPVVGCSHVSPGCDNCYAERMACRLASMEVKAFDDEHDGPPPRPFMQGKYYDVTDLSKRKWNGYTYCDPSALEKPLHWRNPCKIFVCSMGDIFHESVPFEFIDKVMAVIALCPQHTFQVLTKRGERMKEYFDYSTDNREHAIAQAVLDLTEGEACFMGDDEPLPNLWLGVTAENQEQWGKRVNVLSKIPAAHRFVSVEPMLSGIDGCLELTDYNHSWSDGKSCGSEIWHKPDLVICGGESGPGARPMHPDWARGLRDQCESAGVAFHFKQWGEWLPLSQAKQPWACCTQTKRKTKDGGSIYELFDYNHKIMAKGITEDFGPNKGSAIRVGKKLAGHLLDGVEHRPEF